MNRELLNPKIDFVFKKIFGSVGHENITANFLSCVLKKKVTNVELDVNPILEPEFIDDKFGILDIRAKIDNEINCDIEMQVVDRNDIEKRILFYWGKMYIKGIKPGEEYDKLKKSIVILITDYNIKGLENIPKYATKWNLREEDYYKEILTDTMEIYIIELPKFRNKKSNNKADQLAKWVNFIENPEVIDMCEIEISEKDKKDLEEARRILSDLSIDEETRFFAEQREQNIMDRHAIERAGYSKGKDAGLRIAAKNMKEKGMDINVIKEVTGLTEEEIQEEIEEI